MQIRRLYGDLIQLTKEGWFDSIGHGCNCFHTMGSGIAPLMNSLSDGELLKADKKTSCGDINKLGSISWTDVTVNNHSVRMFNLYTQFNYGTQDNVYVHWLSFESALSAMVSKSPGDRIAIPLIGCGLAGGEVRDFLRAVNNVASVHRPNKILYIVEFG